MAAADRGWAAPPLAPPGLPQQTAKDGVLAARQRPAAARPDAAEAPAALISPERLAEFFAPRSIAVVGASDTSAWARFVLASAAATGFSGELIPVHHVRRTVFGRPAVASLRDLPEPADLAFILVPTDAVQGVLDDAGAAGVRGAIVLASGYRETGPEGQAAEAQLTARAAANGITLLGPNCLGFLNAHAKAGPFALTVPLPLLAGPVGIALQSGALASVMLSFARSRAIGVSTLATMGNEAMITATDMVNYLIEDEHTKVICLFLEQIGDPAAFAAAAGRADRAGKPTVVLKAGSSAAGSQAALAHTGSVAGDDAVVDAALRQLNVIRVTSIEELLTTGALLGYGRPLRGRRMGVLTASGGACDIIADQASARGIEIPPFAPDTAAAIAPHVPPFAQVRNPLDVTGYFLANQRTSALTAIDHALDAAVSDPGLDFVLFSGLTLPDARPADEKLASMLDERVAWLGQRMDSAPIPVIAVGSTCVDVTPYGRDLMGRNGIHLLGGMDLGVQAIGHAIRWSERRAHVWPGPAGTTTMNPCCRQDDIKGSSLSPEAGVWREGEARGLLAEFEVPLVPGELVTSPEAAAAAASRIGYPVALRISSANITHKSDIGGVALDLRTVAQLRAGYQRVSTADPAGPDSTAGPADPDSTAGPAGPDSTAGPAGPDGVDGVMVSKMRTGGTELLAGVTVDPAFGPVLVVGLGGIWVEVLGDIALRVLPVGPDDVIAMLGELKGAPLLRGARGRPPADLDALARVILRLADAALSLGDSLRSLEVNPLWVDGDQIEALDVLVVTEPPEHDKQSSNRPIQNRTEHRT